MKTLEITQAFRGLPPNREDRAPSIAGSSPQDCKIAPIRPSPYSALAGMTQVKYDIVIYGATGFVGQLICRYLSQETVNDTPLRWAIAGRNAQKLQDLAASLEQPELPLIVAQAQDPASLAAMCAQTKVVVSTVGPYNRYGEALLAQCATSGTDYVDLCGETLWLKEMLDRYQSKAKASGARICPSAGFDSVPSDMGVWWLQEQSQVLYSSYCKQIKMRVISIKGGMSGGTFASMTDTAAQAAADPRSRRALMDPYLLAEPCPGSRPRQARNAGVHQDPQFEGWMGPFIMEVTNSRVVHRSHSLIDFAYGHGFRYDEAMRGGRGRKGWLRAQGLSKGIALSMILGSIGPVRRILHRTILPKAGEGPSEEAMREGFFNMQFWGAVDQTRTLKVRVAGYEDPGYASTAKMLTQAALCLAFDQSQDDVPGGFWTPATALKGPYLRRLERYAGLRFERIQPTMADGPVG